MRFHSLPQACFMRAASTRILVHVRIAIAAFAPPQPCIATDKQTNNICCVEVALAQACVGTRPHWAAAHGAGGIVAAFRFGMNGEDRTAPPHQLLEDRRASAKDHVFEVYM
jgi:hypothetical protein